MEFTVQLEMFDNQPKLSRGQKLYQHTMKDGTVLSIAGTPINDRFHYHKSQDNTYWLTHTETGKFVTSAKKVKSLKALVQEPEFFDEEISPRRLAEAVNRFFNREGWGV